MTKMPYPALFLMLLAINIVFVVVASKSFIWFFDLEPSPNAITSNCAFAAVILTIITGALAIIWIVKKE